MSLGTTVTYSSRRGERSRKKEEFWLSVKRVFTRAAPTRLSIQATLHSPPVSAVSDSQTCQGRALGLAVAQSGERLSL